MGSQRLQAKQSFAHADAGVGMQRVDVPCTALGLTAPPGPGDIRVHKDAHGWTLAVSCRAAVAEPFGAWLLGLGALDVEASEGGDPLLLRARFAQLPPRLESTLHQARPERTTLRPDGSATLLVRGEEDHAVRLLQRLQAGPTTLVQAATLTSRQAELLQYCVTRGYYAIPRRATLRQLGKELGLSTTSLSLALRRAEGKIILAFDAQLRTQTPKVGVPPPPFPVLLDDALRPVADASEVQAVAARLLGERLGVDLCYYMERQGDRLVVERQAKAPGASLSALGSADLDLHQAFTRPLGKGETIVVADTMAAGRTQRGASAKDLAGQARAGMRALLAAPLMKDGRFVGALVAAHGAPRHWGADDIALVEATAERTWAGVERTRAEAEARAAHGRLGLLARLREAVRVEGDERGIAQAAARLLVPHLGVERCYVVHIDPGRDAAVVDVEHHAAGLPRLAGEFRASDFPDLHRRMLRRELRIDDVAAEDGLSAAERTALERLGLRAILAQPVRREGPSVWALAVASSAPRRWSEADAALVQEVADRTWLAAARARAETALRLNEGSYLAAFDTLEQGVQVMDLERDATGRVVDARVARVNPAWGRIMPVDPSRILGRRVSEWMPSLGADWYAVHERVAAQGRPERSERAVAAFGRWYDATYLPLGKDRVIVLFTDTTAQHGEAPAPRPGKERARRPAVARRGRR